jgi:hypothetical protein
MIRRKTAGTRQDLRQHTPAARHVQDDQHGGAEIARQLSGQNAERFDAPR